MYVCILPLSSLKNEFIAPFIHGIFFISQYWFRSLYLLYLHFVFVYLFTSYMQLTFVFFFAKTKYHYSSKEKKK